MALSVFLLEQLVTALESAEATKPRRYSRASAIAAKLIPGAGGRDRIGSDDDEKKPKLHSLVLTRNREIAASLAVREGRIINSLFSTAVVYCTRVSFYYYLSSQRTNTIINFVALLIVLMGP